MYNGTRSLERPIPLSNMTNPVGQDAVILEWQWVLPGPVLQCNAYSPQWIHVISGMAELNAGLGSSEPITRSEELACPSNRSDSAILNCLEKAEEALIIFYMIVVVFCHPETQVVHEQTGYRGFWTPEHFEGVRYVF